MPGQATAQDGSDLALSSQKWDKEEKNRPKYHPDEEERRRTNSIKRKYEEKDISKRAYEKTWFINGSFIRGQHYIVFNDYTRTFEVPFRVPPHRVRMVINYLMAYYRRTRARLTAHRPGFYIRPQTTEQEDVERARLAEKVVDSELDRLRFQKKFKTGVGWMLETGSYLWYVSWNPWAGDPLTQEEPVMNPETGEPQIDPQTGQPVMQEVPVTDEHGRQLFTGDNELEIVSPYEIEIDPQANDTDDAEWIMRNKIRSLNWVRENYPEKGHFVENEPVYLHSFYQKRLKQLVGILGYTTEGQYGESDQDSPKDHTTVHEYWERPSVKHPQGRYIVVAGKVELYNGPNPYQHKRFPLVKTDEIEITGRFWGMASIEQAIPLQKNLNKARSQEIENRTLMGRPKIMVPRTAKIRQSSFDAEAGERIDYNTGPRGEKPELIPPPATTHATQQEIQNTISDLQEVLSWHEVSRGILPSANVPGVAVDMLQRADETPLGDVASNIEGGLTEMVSMLLSNCSQFWTEERMVRSAGEGNRLEAMKVRGQDLGSTFDIQIVPGSTLQRDPVAQRNMVKELIDMGLLNALEHRKIMFRMLDVGQVDQVFEDQHLDEQWASRENELLERGEFSVPRDFENHETHVEVHDRFRKGERYRRLPDENKKMVDAHVELHRRLAFINVQRQTLEQLQIQAVANPEEGQEAQPASQAKG